MMIIAVLSDTHIRPGKNLPRQVWNTLTSVDMILHAGDMLTAEFYEDLQSLAPVTAVRGNGDFCLSELPEKTIVDYGSLKIGLVHGHRGRGKTTPERALSNFAGERVDLVIFGHSHAVYNGTLRGVHLFNPGSPTEKRLQKYPSMGILNIEGREYEIRHMFFNE